MARVSWSRWSRLSFEGCLRGEAKRCGTEGMWGKPGAEGVADAWKLWYVWETVGCLGCWSAMWKVDRGGDR